MSSSYGQVNMGGNQLRTPTSRSLLTWLLAMVSLHHLGFLAGTILMADGIIGLIFGPGMGLDPIQWVQEFTIVAFGMILMFVESSDRAALPCCRARESKPLPFSYRDFSLYITTKLRQILYHYAKFVFVPYGRGAYYVYCSILLFSQFPDKLDVTVGVFMLALSVVAIVVGCRSAVKLKMLKESFNDASDIKNSFAKYHGAEPRLNGVAAEPRLSREEFWELANG